MGRQRDAPGSIMSVELTVDISLFIRSGRDYFYPSDRKELFGQGGGRQTSQSIVDHQEKDEVTVSKVKDYSLPFQDHNR